MNIIKHKRGGREGRGKRDRGREEREKERERRDKMSINKRACYLEMCSTEDRSSMSSHQK
jgi:hypothetical protein